MSDTEDGFTEEVFKQLADNESPTAPPAKDEEPATPAPETPKEDEKPVEDAPKPEGEAPAEDKKPEETPPVPEAPAEPVQPLTKSDVESVVSNLLNTERASSRELENSTREVLEAYYPEGLSNVLVDEKSGRELRTPQDVVDVSDGEMSMEQAAQWLMNEQHKLDVQVANIKDQARQVAETNLNFRRDAVTVVEKYKPLFEAYPHLQKKVYDKLMKQVKVDKERGVILSAPDVIEHYDDYLEPYQERLEAETQKPATAPTPNPAEPPKPTLEDRMDEIGDGGISPVDDPNDFAQQVNKELAKGI